jgi:hypothetical protein
MLLVSKNVPTCNGIIMFLQANKYERLHVDALVLHRPNTTICHMYPNEVHQLGS